MSAAKRCAEVGTFLNGKIDRVSVVINEVELSGNLCKGKLTSLDTMLKSVQNVLFVKRCTGAIEGFKIAVNGIRCVEQVVGPLGGIHGVDILRKHGERCQTFQLERSNDAFFRVASALPVAAPGGLEQGIQPGGFTVSKRKIDIDACFDQRGGDDPAGKPRLEPLADFVQLSAAVSGTEKGGQAVAAFGGELCKQILGGLAPVDHTEHLFGRRKLCAEGLSGEGAQILPGHAAKDFIEVSRVGAEFFCGQAGGKLLKQRRQGGLRCGAENGGGVVVLDQLCDGGNAGLQVIGRERLCFIKKNDAVGNVVQFAAPAAAVGVEGFEELHSGRHHDGSVPVFAGKQFPVLSRCQVVFFGQLVVYTGKVGQHIVFSQKICERLRRLVDNGSVGDDVNDALHLRLLCHSMFQRKGEGREGFAAARGNCERIKPLWCMSTLFHAGPQYFVPLLRDRGSGRAVKVAFGLCPDFFQQSGKWFPHPTRGCFTVHEGLGVDEIGIDQAGVEHPGEKGHGQVVRLAEQPRRQSGFGRGDLLFPLRAIFDPPLGAADQRAFVGSVMRISEVGDATVVSGNGQRGGNVSVLDRGLGSGSGVVNGRAALQALLETSAIFSDVMKQGGIRCFCLCAKRCGKVSGQCSRAGQVFFDGLCAGLVITDVREQLHKRSLLNDRIPLPYEKWKLLSIGILPIISV